MKILSALVLAAALAFAGSAFGQAVNPVTTLNSSRATGNLSSTIAVTNTFQSIQAKTTARMGCLIQNNGANTMWVYFGDITGATKAKSAVLGATQSLNCSTSGISATDQVSITGTAADAFTVMVDGAPSISPPSSVSTSGGGTQSVNLAQVAGTTTAAGNGATTAGTQRVTLSNDGTGVIASITSSVVPGVAATNLGKSEDAVHTTGDTGVFALGVTTDGSTALNSGTGDYSVLGTDTAGNERVVGSVASGATDSGNPVKIGGVFNTTPPTLTTGQRGDVQFDSSSNVRTRMNLTPTTGADGVSNTSTIGFYGQTNGASGNQFSASANYYLNGSGTWDRQRGDATGGMWSQGAVASGAADSGNPIKIGCKVNTTSPTFVDGNRGDCQLGTEGSVVASPRAGSVTLADATSNTTFVDGGIGLTTGGLSASFKRTMGYEFNGVSWDRPFTCPNSAVINVTAAATTQLVALASTQIIRVCSFAITSSAAGTAKFVYGTGANCVTGTTDITAAWTMATGTPIAISAGSNSVFRTIASNELCLAATGGTITGFVSYAQY